MAEGGLESIFGDEGAEREEVSESESAGLGSAAAFAAAVASAAAKQDPRVAAETSDFLKKQGRLTDIQAAHLEHEHVLRLQHLHNQLREESVRRLGLRIRVAFQLFFAAAATALGIGAVILLHDALSSRGVVVEVFDAPVSLEPTGITGKTIASAVLDQLRKLQASTRTDVASRELSGSWGEAIKIEIPDVGVSIAELSRVLKARFGHDLHVDGDLLQPAQDQLALTVRSIHFPSKTFTGPAADRDVLLTKAAEYIYSQAEPVRWAYYLTNHDRYQEAIDFSSESFATVDKSLRPYLLHTWAIAAMNVGDLPAAERLNRASIRLKPDYWDSYNNLQLNLGAQQDEEGAWRTAMEMKRAAGGRPGRAPEDDYIVFDGLTGDESAIYKYTSQDADDTGGVGTRSHGVLLIMADAKISLHDPEAAQLILETVKPDPTDKQTVAMSHFENGRLAMETGHLDKALREMETFLPLYQDPGIMNEAFGVACLVAPVEEAARHPDRADEVLRTAGRFVDCYRFRGDILDGRGDWDGAQKAYAEAAALAPDLPASYYSWGVALARHGDLTGALAQLSKASQRGPHWADPLKAWGDVLVKSGQRSQALLKYNEALSYAPNWSALKDARAALAAQRIP